MATAAHSIASVARHSAEARTPVWRLVLGFALRARWRYLLHLPSNYAWMVAARKYDAITTDRAYDNAPSSWLGPLGRWADRRVLEYPVHVALRERLEVVTAGLASEIESRLDADRTVRVLSAPSGLGRDVRQALSRLRERGVDLERVSVSCLDLDASGEVHDAAREHFRAAGLAATFHRLDIFDEGAIRELAGPGFDVVNCQGLTAWLDFPEVARLLRVFAGVLRPGGVLLIDNFAPHAHSSMAHDLEMRVRYHNTMLLRASLREAGFREIEERTSSQRIVTVYTCRRAG